MPAPTTDGTLLNPVQATGGDLVSDEDMTGAPRLSSLVPQLGAVNASYKVERTKIALGDYDTDRGDASSDGGRPMPMETFVERRLQEEQYLRATEAQYAKLTRRTSERPPALFFSRTGREGRV
jgi:hypothetical protein